LSARVAFAGMTHLGINSAAATAERGFHVIGYDPDPDRIREMRALRLPVVEPQLNELIARNAARLQFSADVADLRDCDIVYVAPDVPTDGGGQSDLGPIKKLIDTVVEHLRDEALLVVLSQVPPGFTRSLGKLVGGRLFYQVETLIFGRAVERALYPERFIVGGAEPRSPLPARYKEVLEAFGCPILQMRYESAELAKISINLCLVSSLSVANTLGELCESIGADWAEIVPAIKLDKRIGQHAYLKPGLGIAGGNLERDLRTVLELAQRSGMDTRVVEAWMANSDHRKEWCWRVLRDHVLVRAPQSRIAVLGLAYKENTHSTKGSPSLALLAHLKDADVRVHDPVVQTSIVPFAMGCADPLACVAGADVLVIATPWPEYGELGIAELSKLMDGRVIIDPYRLLDGAEAVRHGFQYYALGVMPGAVKRDA
jgi:UDPglucose 6-dehydrogenase